MWLAGGGVKPGRTFGETDEYSYNIVKDPVHVHDLHATILHTLGIDHTRLTYKFQGRAFRLTDVQGNVVKLGLGGSGSVPGAIDFTGPSPLTSLPVWASPFHGFLQFRNEPRAIAKCSRGQEPFPWHISSSRFPST